jgi:hypothetical protein
MHGSRQVPPPGNRQVPPPQQAGAAATAGFRRDPLLLAALSFYS